MKKTITSGLMIILILPIVFFFVDFSFAKFNRPPLFAIKTAMYKDGGTADYKGFGYRIIDYNELVGEGRQDVVFISKFLRVGNP